MFIIKSCSLPQIWRIEYCEFCCCLIVLGQWLAEGNLVYLLHGRRVGWYHMMIAMHADLYHSRDPVSSRECAQRPNLICLLKTLTSKGFSITIGRIFIKTSMLISLSEWCQKLLWFKSCLCKICMCFAWKIYMAFKRHVNHPWYQLLNLYPNKYYSTEG